MGRAFYKDDVIRVHDWPATAKRKFLVREVRPTQSGGVVFAFELDQKWNTGKARAFPVSHCAIDVKQTQAYAGHLRRVGQRLQRES